jgi:hypothetical protein
VFKIQKMAKQKPTGLQKEGKNQLSPPVYQKKDG